MRKLSKILYVLGVSAVLGSMFSSCSDDNEIVRVYNFDGNWTFNGMTYLVETNLVPVDNFITEDIKSRNLTSHYILNLDTKKKTYLLTESTILKDSGRYVIDSELVKFDSKYLSKAILEDGNIYMDNENIKLSYDVIERYKDKEVLKSIGVPNPDAVIVFKANYSLLFKK